MGHQANLSVKGPDLKALTQEHGWRMRPINKPIDPDAQGEWISYLVNLVGMVTIAIKKLVDFDRAYDALDTLMDIRQGFTGHRLSTEQLFEIEPQVEVQLKRLLANNRPGGLSKFDQVVPSLDDLMESLVRAQATLWLTEYGVSIEQAEEVFEACTDEYIGEALNYIDIVDPDEIDGQALLVALSGIDSLYGSLGVVDFAQVAKHSLSKLNIPYPKGVEDDDLWADGREYDDVDFKKIIGTAKVILIAKYAH
jgi:hypothetical protein